MITLFNFIVLAYKPYNLKIRLSLCFHLYFVVALFIRIFFMDFKSYILIIFFLMLFIFLIIPLVFLLSLSWIFCNIYKFMYVKIFQSNIIFIKILNLCYNIRLGLTRGYNSVLLSYNLIIICMFLINIPYVNFIRLTVGSFLLLGSIIDILHQCFLYYKNFGLLVYDGPGLHKYTTLEWNNKQSVLMQVRYNQIVLQRINYLFMEDKMFFYSQAALFYGFRPAYRLDKFLGKMFSYLKKPKM